MRLSVVIPARNEEEVIGNTVNRLSEKLSGDCEIVVIDDNSSDGTFNRVKEIAYSLANVRLIRNRYEKGFAGALKTGFDDARGEVIVPVMADLSDQPETIPLMCVKIQEGYDLVSASRYIKGGKRTGGPLSKALLSRLSSWLIHSLTGIPVTDFTNSYKAYRRSILENIPIESRGFEISMEIVLKAYSRGYRLTEVPTVWRERTTGKSNFAFFRDGSSFLRWLVFALNLKRRRCDG